MSSQVVEHAISLRFVPAPKPASWLQEEVLLGDVENSPLLTYADPYGNCALWFEMYQPEFDAVQPEDGLQTKDGLVWVLTFGASQEIPLSAKRQTDEMPCAQDVVRELVALVAKHLPGFRYIRSTEYKKFQFSTTSNLNF
jgi:hypothetical protein